ncbi:GNAT family N-acetyltransferase [Microlunatus flavus]|nr:GNAT family N-acetyltransferase [Microlunatus flavus]
MTPDDLDLLPEPCGSCAFWETSVGDLASPVEHRARASRKAEWAQQVTDRWGYCGVVAVHDEEVVAFLTLAPAGLVRRLPAFATTPVGTDVAVLLSAQVVESWRGKGLGRQLVTTAAGLVARRDLRALEAVGTRREGPSCMMPVSWLESVGFAVVREHPVTPRLRMDLQTTQRWPGFGAAWSRLTGLVAPAASPQPAAYAGREARDPQARPTTPAVPVAAAVPPAVQPG